MRVPQPSSRAFSLTLGVVAAVLVGSAITASMLTGRWHLGLLGLLAGLTCVAAVGYYRGTVRLMDPHGKADGRVSWLPEDAARAAAVVLPVIAGAVATSVTEDWRWAATGLVGGAFLPGLVDTVRDSLRFEGPGGIVSAAFAWMFVGALAGPLAWLWSADPVPGLVGFGVPFGIGVLFLLAIGLAVNG